MISTHQHSRPLEHRIAVLLRYGTWLSSMVIAIGMGMNFFAATNGYFFVKLGVALFILLPITRVLLTIFLFLKERDYLYAVIAAVVLAVIIAGMLLHR